ncbi:MAG: hypothetical protein WBR26_26540 [Candidatus Acidiferrum sp.]
MPNSPHNKPQNKWLAAAFLPLLAAVGLCAFQFGDRNNLNSMPFAQVQPLVANLPQAQKLASAGNIELLVDQAAPGKPLSLHGELTDANCFLGNHTHAYDHAFCAKLCAAAGSPLLFLSDQGGRVYVVLTQTNAVRIPDSVLNQIGVPGIIVKGKVLNAKELPALAVESISQ